MKTEIKVHMVEWFNDHWYKLDVEKEVNADMKGIDANLETETLYFPSVTTKLGVIAKPFLAHWRGDLGNREADLRQFEASQRGVRIHHAWYVMTTGGVIVYQPFQRPNYSQSDIDTMESENMGNLAVVRYQDEMYDLHKLSRWLKAVNPEIRGSEIINYSIPNKDAGTLDNLFFIKEGDYLINGAKPLHLPEGLYVADLKTGKVVDDDAFMQTACYAKNIQEMGFGDPIGTLILHTGSAVRTAIEGLSTLYRSKEQMEQDYLDYRLAAALWDRKNANAKPKIFEFPALLTYQKENENDKKPE